MGRVGSCFDNAAAEAFFSSLEWEVCPATTSTHTTGPGCHDRLGYGFYNHQRRHSTIGMVPPVQYEQDTARRDRDAA